MSTAVLLVILFSAFLHASWNAVLKARSGGFVDIAMITGGAALVSAVALVFLNAPVAASWPYIVGSAVIHVVYFVLTAAVYRNGDMSLTYPVMRGAAPPLVALASGPLVGEHLPMGQWLGLMLICGGISGLVLANPALRHMARAASYALLNALVICTYTLVDGIGVRLSGEPASYTMWVFVLTSPPIIAWALLRYKTDVQSFLSGRWYIGLLGGICTTAAYALALWAMTRAPIATVAALRETAILFGTAISAFILKERMGFARPFASAVILLGVVTLKLA